MDDVKETAEITQVRRISRLVPWTSRTLGEVRLPIPGSGPEPEMMTRLRSVFEEEARFERLKQKMMLGRA